MIKVPGATGEQETEIPRSQAESCNKLEQAAPSSSGLLRTTYADGVS